jgi:hypothetical protein
MSKTVATRGTVGFDLRFFKVVDANGNKGNVRLKDEPVSNTVFFRDFQQLEGIIKTLMKGK